jgi:hypothetical protein
VSWPTITRGKGWWDDLFIVNPYYTWVLQGVADADTGTMGFIYGDYMDLDLTGVGGDASMYAEYPDFGGGDDIEIGSLTYPYVFYRYKCSNANVKAKIELVWSDDAVKTVLAATNNEDWTYGATEITGDTGKNIDHVRLYATTAIGHVYYDFICIGQGVFEFPGANLVELILPNPRRGNIPIPGKDGVAPQNLGSEPAQVRISADMDTTSDWNDGKVFDQISHDLSSDLWQWLTLPAHDRQFKATLADSPRMPFEDGKLRLELLFEEYKLANARSFENYAERFGH